MKPTKLPYFFAQWGDVKTYSPWRTVTLESAKDWWKQFKGVSGVENFDVYVGGSFAENTFGNSKLPPKDLDIILIGEVDDLESLKYILSAGVQIGWYNKIMVDICWANRIHNKDVWEPLAKIRPGKVFTKIMGDRASTYEYPSDEEHRLEHGLWQQNYYEPPSSYFKWITRIEDGHYQGLQLLCKEVL